MVVPKTYNLFFIYIFDIARCLFMFMLFNFCRVYVETMRKTLDSVKKVNKTRMYSPLLHLCIRKGLLSEVQFWQKYEIILIIAVYTNVKISLDQPTFCAIFQICRDTDSCYMQVLLKLIFQKILVYYTYEEGKLSLRHAYKNIQTSTSLYCQNVIFYFCHC